MPDITLSVSLSHKKYSGQPLPFACSLTLTQSGSEASKQIINVPTSWTAIRQWSFSSEGIIAIQNMDATNYVEIALANDNSGVFARLVAGGSPLILPVLDSATYYAKANTAACDISVLATEA